MVTSWNTHQWWSIYSWRYSICAWVRNDHIQWISCQCLNGSGCQLFSVSFFGLHANDSHNICTAYLHGVGSHQHSIRALVIKVLVITPPWGMSLIYKHEAEGAKRPKGSAYKLTTCQKGGVICDLFAKQQKHGRKLIGFLPNKESVMRARTNPVHYHSLGELVRRHANQAETSVRLPLWKPLPLWRRCFAHLLQCDRRHQRDLAGRVKLAQRNDGGTARWIGDQLRWNWN